MSEEALTESLKSIIIEYLLTHHNIQNLDDELEQKLYRFLLNFVDVYIVNYIVNNIKKDSGEG